jgi:hypothetical protein
VKVKPRLLEPRTPQAKAAAMVTALPQIAKPNASQLTPAAKALTQST